MKRPLKALKKKGKSNRQKLTAQLDELVSKIVRKRMCCQRCGSREMLQAHHIIPRSRSLLLRWDLRNLLCLCKGCHYWYHNVSTTYDTQELRERCLTRDEDKFLCDFQHTSVKFSVSELEDRLEKLKQSAQGF